MVTSFGRGYHSLVLAFMWPTAACVGSCIFIMALNVPVI